MEPSRTADLADLEDLDRRLAEHGVYVIGPLRIGPPSPTPDRLRSIREEAARPLKPLSNLTMTSLPTPV